jgi:hypothetical protein
MANADVCHPPDSTSRSSPVGLWQDPVSPDSSLALTAWWRPSLGALPPSGADGLGIIRLVRSWFMACPAQDWDGFSARHRESTLAVAEGFEPSEAFTSHAFEV